MTAVNHEWQSTTGMVFISKVKTHKISERNYVDYPDIYYSYQVGGQLYESAQIILGPYTPRAGEESVLKRYPSGAQVTVVYNPQDPAEAVLARKAPDQVTTCCLLVLLDSILCGSLIWMALQQ